MTNRNFARLVDEQLEYSPWPIKADGRDIFSTDTAVQASHGFKPVVRTEQPTAEGYSYTASWEDTGEAITQVWTATEIPAEEPGEPVPTLEERLAAAEGTISAHDTEIDQIVTGLEALAGGTT